jgi:hypothetical protein
MDALLREIAEAYRITIDEMEVSVDHVHIFCSFPPTLSITQAVTRLKSLSARAIFREFPQVKHPLWGQPLGTSGQGAVSSGKTATLPAQSAIKSLPMWCVGTSRHIGMHPMMVNSIFSKMPRRLRRRGLYLFVFLAAVAIGTFIGGPIGDRYGRKYVIWISILVRFPSAS